MTVAAEKLAVKAWQAELIKLGYLPKGSDDGNLGSGSVRALARFQRHAGRVYRMSGITRTSADVVPGQVFRGSTLGRFDEATRIELKKWVDTGWVLPLGRFPLKKVGDFTLREDVAVAWTAVAARIKALGGTVDGPYGDSKRGLGKATKVGASSFSFHIVGRAIDLNQAFANPSGRRYWIARDHWRIHCKTLNQDGTQGTLYEKGEVKCQGFQPNVTFDIPKGHYIDLTAELERDGKFERIPAHGGWDTNYNKTEWWDFQYLPDKQETFQDECELIGIGEADLKKAGYSVTDMDRKPG